MYGKKIVKGLRSLLDKRGKSMQAWGTHEGHDTREGGEGNLAADWRSLEREGRSSFDKAAGLREKKEKPKMFLHSVSGKKCKGDEWKDKRNQGDGSIYAFRERGREKAYFSAHVKKKGGAQYAFEKELINRKGKRSGGQKWQSLCPRSGRLKERR